MILFIIIIIIIVHSCGVTPNTINNWWNYSCSLTCSLQEISLLLEHHLQLIKNEKCYVCLYYLGYLRQVCVHEEGEKVSSFLFVLWQHIFNSLSFIIPAGNVLLQLSVCYSATLCFPAVRTQALLKSVLTILSVSRNSNMSKVIVQNYFCDDICLTVL